jgi:hypothetical protein
VIVTGCAAVPLATDVPRDEDSDDAGDPREQHLVEGQSVGVGLKLLPVAPSVLAVFTTRAPGTRSATSSLDVLPWRSSAAQSLVASMTT